MQKKLVQKLYKNTGETMFRYKISTLDGRLLIGSIKAPQYSKAAWQAALTIYKPCFVERLTGIMGEAGKFAIYQFRNGRRHYLGYCTITLSD